MILIVLAVCCFLLAAFFGLMLVGYRVMAMLLFGLGLLCLVFRWLNRQKHKLLRLILIALLILGLAALVAAEVPVISASRGDPDPEADYLIVLGAGVNGSPPSLSMTDRLRAAPSWLEAYPDGVAVLSGGQGDGEDLTEAQAMFNWLTARGIASERLLLEEKASSTEENLLYSKAIIDARGDADAVIAVCSSEYHLCRAKRIGESLGIALLGVPARTSLPVLKLNYFIREGAAVAYYRIVKGI